MCSGNSKVSSILDPGNFFGKRPGGMNIAGAMNPGNQMVKGVTGKDNQLTNPGNLLKDYDSEEQYKTTQEAFEPMSEQERQSRTSTTTSGNKTRQRIGSLYPDYSK